MSELRAILIDETPLARKFRVADRELWIPKSVVKSITKFKPDAKGHRECVANLEEWYAEKYGL